MSGSETAPTSLFAALVAQTRNETLHPRLRPRQKSRFELEQDRQPADTTEFGDIEVEVPASSPTEPSRSALEGAEGNVPSPREPGVEHNLEPGSPPPEMPAVLAKKAEDQISGSLPFMRQRSEANPVHSEHPPRPEHVPQARQGQTRAETPPPLPDRTDLDLERQQAQPSRTADPFQPFQGERRPEGTAPGLPHAVTVQTEQAAAHSNTRADGRQEARPREVPPAARRRAPKTVNVSLGSVTVIRSQPPEAKRPAEARQNGSAADAGRDSVLTDYLGWKE